MKIETTEEHKVTADKLRSAYFDAISGAKKIAMLGLLAEVAFLERARGTYMSWVEGLDISYGTVSNARRMIKRIISDSPAVWSTIMSLKDPSIILTADVDKLVPRLGDIQRKILDAVEGKTIQALEHSTGIRKEQTNGVVDKDEVEEIVAKRNPKPIRQGKRHGEPSIERKPLTEEKRKDVETIVFGGNSDRKQSYALIGRVQSLLEIDNDKLLNALTAKQRENIALRLRLLADKLDGKDIEMPKPLPNVASIDGGSQFGK